MQQDDLFLLDAIKSLNQMQRKNLFSYEWIAVSRLPTSLAE